jgi:nicotinate-nucleotide adenylyltransferase
MLAIYGGAFNPPTLGHVAAVEELVRGGFDLVLVMPCFGHTFGKSLAPAGDRLVMATEAFRHIPEVRVSSLEIDLGMNGSTYELVRRLPMLPEFNTHDAFMAIGTDEANEFYRWRRADELREMINFVAIPRPNHPLKPSGEWILSKPHLLLPGEIKKDASSTAVKAALADGDTEAAGALLNPRVLDYIVERNLYSTTEAAALCPPR